MMYQTNSVIDNCFISEYFDVSDDKESKKDMDY